MKNLSKGFFKILQFPIFDKKKKKSLDKFFSKKALRAHAILLVWKIYPCLFIPNCTWNHVITYTNHICEKEI